MKTVLRICSLILVITLLFSYVPPAYAAPSVDLTCSVDGFRVSWIGGGPDAIDVCISESSDPTPDGIVTIDFSITNKKTITYNLSFEPSGNVTAVLPNGKDFFEIVNQSALKFNNRAQLFPLIGNSTLNLSASFPSNSNLSIKVNKFGEGGEHAIALLTLGLGSILSKAFAGIDVGQAVSNDPDVAFNFIGTILTATRNIGFDMTGFIAKLYTGDYYGAVEALAKVIEVAPQAWVTLTGLTKEVIEQSARTIGAILQLGEFVPFLYDLATAPGSGGLTISRGGTALDLAFVIDTTGSMSDDIAAVKQNAVNIVNNLKETNPDFRIALVDFRDFPVYPYGAAGDYDYKDDLTFTTDTTAAINAINGLTIGNGMDWNEDHYCALMHAIDGNTCRGSGIGSGIGTWRNIPKKFIILMTDAPPHDPEPFTGFTENDVKIAAENADPITIEVVSIGGVIPILAQLAADTGGQVFTAESASDVVLAITEAIGTISKSPIANAGGPYLGQPGDMITFDAGFSYDPDGSITLCEWDIDDDGVFEVSSSEISFTNVYNSEYHGNITLRVTDNDGNKNIATTTIDIEPPLNNKPVLTIPIDQIVQYSDFLAFSASAIDMEDPSSALTFYAVNLPHDLSMTDNRDGTVTVSGLAYVSPGTYPVEITVTDSGGLSDTKTVSIIVTQEDASITYTGPLLFSTSCSSCSTTTIPLRATIQDITDVLGDPAYDPYPGDITNATVTFINRDNADAVLCSTNVALLDPVNPSVGTATCDWLVDIGSSNGTDNTIGIVVEGYYTRNAVDDNTLVVVSKPVSNFITGGGYIINQTSSGVYAGDPDLKTNFGLNFKFTKKLTNLQGRVTIIVRKDGRVYQIKSTALNSLVVVPYSLSNPKSGTAEVVGKANVTDVTDPVNPVALEGNASLNLVMKDNGEPGSADLIGISLWNKNGTLLYSSSWDGKQTLKSSIDGGNLSVK